MLGKWKNAIIAKLINQSVGTYKSQITRMYAIIGRVIQLSLSRIQQYMAHLGKHQILTIKRFLESGTGALLEGGDLGDIFIDQRQLERDAEVGDPLQVFVYHDSQDRIAAVSRKPKVEVGQIANLEVTNVNRVGAFLDWGLPKELLVPFGQQKVRMEQGCSYSVIVYVDERTGRIVASSKLENFISDRPNGLKKGQQVHLTVTDRTPLGYKCAINNQQWGMLFEADADENIRVGKQVKGFIKRIREDGKVDVWLQASKKEDPRVDALQSKILAHLKKNGGFSHLNDKGDPDEIKRLFKISKAKYKKALGALYKDRKIDLTNDGVKLL